MFLDTRLGNMPRWWLTPPKDWNMRVPDEVHYCVVFVGRVISIGAGAEQRRPLGTAFVVGLPSEADPSTSYLYLVTARHVAKQLSLGGPWFIRFTTADGTFGEVMVPDGGGWHYHPTEPEEVDAAVMELALPPEARFKLIHEKMFATDEVIRERNVGVGDEVFITGLFTKMSGRRKNVPLMRMGNVAMLPPEKVPGVLIDRHDPKARAVESEVYLIEARSIGGLSGSPVFVCESVFINQRLLGGRTLRKHVQTHATGDIFLLGLMHGHWDIKEEDMNDVEIVSVDRKNNERQGVNLGIALVVPAKRILEILHQPALVDGRRRHDRESRDAEGATAPDADWPT